VLQFVSGSSGHQIRSQQSSSGSFIAHNVFSILMVDCLMVGVAVYSATDQKHVNAGCYTQRLGSGARTKI
jgi:hypothetical protein